TNSPLTFMSESGSRTRDYSADMRYRVRTLQVKLPRRVLQAAPARPRDLQHANPRRDQFARAPTSTNADRDALSCVVPTGLSSYRPRRSERITIGFYC